MSTITINGAEIKAPTPVQSVDLCNGVASPNVFQSNKQDVFSPIRADNGDKILLGQHAFMSADDAMTSLRAAHAAWNNGAGEWPTMTMSQRVTIVEAMLVDLRLKRDAVAEILLWEICKTSGDAVGEFNRTIQYAEQTIAHIKSELKKQDEANAKVADSKSHAAHLERRPIGVTVVLGPSNYPFNETYAMVLPALLSGNTLVMKVPRTGGLCHSILADVLAKHLPKGVFNYVSGSARETMPALMGSGLVDMLAFIGSTKAANSLIRQHPAPYRLNLVLGLEANNPGIVFPSADMKAAVKDCITGSISYNGQRCTALKLMLVHESVASTFVEQFVAAMDEVKCGMPWDSGVKVTPIEWSKVDDMKAFIDDATAKGARVLNNGGGTLLSSCTSAQSIMVPAVLYPVTAEMKIWGEEQFGPVVPIATFSTTEELMAILGKLNHGQQAAVFAGASDANSVINPLRNMVGRLNINVSCSRGPDHLPFGGRKDSALGVLSVGDAMNTFSLDSVLWRRGADLQ